MRLTTHGRHRPALRRALAPYPRRRVGVVLRRDFVHDHVTGREYARLLAPYGDGGGSAAIRSLSASTSGRASPWRASRAARRRASLSPPGRPQAGARLIDEPSRPPPASLQPDLAATLSDVAPASQDPTTTRSGFLLKDKMTLPVSLARHGADGPSGGYDFARVTWLGRGPRSKPSLGSSPVHLRSSSAGGSTGQPFQGHERAARQPRPKGNRGLPEHQVTTRPSICAEAMAYNRRVQSWPSSCCVAFTGGGTLHADLRVRQRRDVNRAD